MSSRGFRVLAFDLENSDGIFDHRFPSGFGTVAVEFHRAYALMCWNFFGFKAGFRNQLFFQLENLDVDERSDSCTLHWHVKARFLNFWYRKVY